MMPSAVDPMDLVRAFYQALNRSDVDALLACYDRDCVLEHVCPDDDQPHVGIDAAARIWSDRLRASTGALPGGRRVDVGRVAGIETGWGWVRSDWVMALRVAGASTVEHCAGHSHFWVEHGLIRRHRCVSQRVTPGAATQHRSVAPRDYPSAPRVGVGAVVLTDRDRVVLVRRRFEPLADHWSLPGGMLELGETLEAGTAREIREETGLEVEVGPVVETFDRILCDDEGRVRYHFVLIDYLCRPLGGVLTAATDVRNVVEADLTALGGFRLTEKVAAVVARAVDLKRGCGW